MNISRPVYEVRDRPGYGQRENVRTLGVEPAIWVHQAGIGSSTSMGGSATIVLGRTRYGSISWSRGLALNPDDCEIMADLGWSTLFDRAPE